MRETKATGRVLLGTSRPRWEGDERGVGIADGAWIAPDVARLQSAVGLPGWVAEAPADHLLPHLARACAASGSPWQLGETEMRPDGVYVVTVIWKGGPVQLREIRAAVFRLVGEVAEESTFVRQVVTDAPIAYHVTTGMLDEESSFAPHGHLMLIRVDGSEVR